MQILSLPSPHCPAANVKPRHLNTNITHYCTHNFYCTFQNMKGKLIWTRLWLSGRYRKFVYNIAQHFCLFSLTFSVLWMRFLLLGTLCMTAFFLMIGFTKLSFSLYSSSRTFVQICPSFLSSFTSLWLITESFPVLTASTMSWASLLSFPPSRKGFSDVDSEENWNVKLLIKSRVNKNNGFKSLSETLNKYSLFVKIVYLTTQVELWPHIGHFSTLKYQNLTSLNYSTEKVILFNFFNIVKSRWFNYFTLRPFLNSWGLHVYKEFLWFNCLLMMDDGFFYTVTL